MNTLVLVVSSLVLSLISMPLIIKFCKKFNIFDYQNSRKIHSGNISRLGGVGIFLAYIIVSLIYLIKFNPSEISNNLPIIIAGCLIFVFALLDDLFNLPAILKLIVQLIAVSLVTFNGFRFTQIFNWKLPEILSFILTFGWILGVINAFNLIDGLDGLCGSLSFTTITTLGIIYFLSGKPEATLCFILAAAIFGFLCFNWPPAKLFMGDGGSQFLGFMIATFPLYTSNDAFEYNKFLIMIIITAFPVFDTIAAIWRRIRDKQSIMSPDRSHLHHKLLNIGYSKTTALLLIAFIQILICSIVIISFNLSAEKGAGLLLETIAFMILFFALIHYSNRRIYKQQHQEEANKTN